MFDSNLKGSAMVQEQAADPAPEERGQFKSIL